MGRLYTALIGLSLIWGTSFLFIKLLLEDMGPAAVVFGRSIFGAILLGAIIIVQKKRLNLKSVPWKSIIFVALLNNVIPWSLISLSETMISSSLASIINATTPIWTILIGFFFFSSILELKQWAGIFIGFIGIFILSDIHFDDLINGSTLGVFLMSSATFCYGFAAQLTKKHLKSLSVMEISFLTLALSSLMSLGIVLGREPESLTLFANASILLRFLGLGAFGSGIAYLLYYYLVQKGSPEFASLVTYLVPVSAVIWGAALLEESIHLYMLIGLSIIFIGVYVASYKTKSVKKVAA
ncbi:MULTISPECIES: DMT family transporter [unclassified Bacillus (in: firmicutes)]|uniref:DMT family transporter n=1 Tax=unclassified Bacillus (in: firmicutes) TaxID=185979 RepID=UPI0008EB6AD9|nr:MULTISPECIES: DMT family transporter [unclassified Bacillus (in: firmicutes)]SFA76541.1 EamA domain-containing membrane protein RarD [Bacillus sp. UNCCL13]SFQ66373.1 EamA domain-containing membrane protein RarD [Bacillus sp. cl95]